MVQVYSDADNNGMINGADAVVAMQQLSGGSTAFAISTPLTQDAANNFVVTSSDAAGNESAPTDVPTITEDSTPPTVAFTRDDADPTNASSVVFSVDFSEDVQNVNAADFDLALSGLTANATVMVGDAGDMFRCDQCLVEQRSHDRPAQYRGQSDRWKQS